MTDAVYNTAHAYGESRVALTPKAITRTNLIALAIILIVAALLRFHNPQVIDYRQDQADLVSLAQDLAEGRSIPLLGIPSSARMPNSPVTAYVVAVPYLFTDNPVFATMFIAAFNVLGVGLLWFIAQRYFNPTIAHVAALAYAVHPWAVGYSRSIWAQDYYTPFFLIALLLGLYGFVEGRRWAQALCLPILFIAMQIHLAAVFLFPVYLWLLWMGRKRLNKAAFVISIALALLTALPYLLGIVQSLNSGQESVTTVTAQTREFSLREIIKPYGQMAWLATGLGQEQYIARERADDLITAVGVPTLHWVLLGGFIFLGVIHLWRRFPRGLAVLVLLWAFVPVIVLTIPIIGIFPHYFVASIAALCLLIGIGVDWLLGIAARQQENVRIIGRFALSGLLATIFLTQAVYVVRATEFIDSVYLPTQFGFGPSVHYLLNVRDALEGYEDVVVVGSGDWVDISAHGSPVWRSLLRQSAACVRDLIAGSSFAVLPAGPFAAVYTPRVPTDSFIDPLYQHGIPTIVELRPEEGVYTIYDHPQMPNWTAQEITEVEPLVFVNAVELTGYHLGEASLLLEWHLPGQDTGSYSTMIEYLDDSGTVLESQTSMFWPGINWCAGDRLLNLNTLTFPEGTAALEVSLWRGNNRLEASGDPLRLPLVEAQAGA